MSYQEHERLMREASAASMAAHAARWQALVTAFQIEKLVALTRPNAGHRDAGEPSA